MTQISQPKYDLIFIPINRQPILPNLLISFTTNCFLTRPKNTCTITSIRKCLRVWSGILSMSSSPIFSWRLAKVSVSAQPVIGCSKTVFITCNTRRHYILMAMNAPMSLTIAKMCFYQQWQNSEAILLSTNLIIYLKRSLKISLLVYTNSSCAWWVNHAIEWWAESRMGPREWNAIVEEGSWPGIPMKWCYLFNCWVAAKCRTTTQVWEELQWILDWWIICQTGMIFWMTKLIEMNPPPETDKP